VRVKLDGIQVTHRQLKKTYEPEFKIDEEMNQLEQKKSQRNGGVQELGEIGLEI